ncbi:unnamed protein product [Orchesella dallaii]|uniref:RIIa domain-containing protein n=1 Tax=Orchesella dallaii TaxID=48710 RepID=A0ABP1QVX6_9HEXA
MASRTLPEMPCGPILELYGQRKRFHVPYGLKGLIEDMTREVLRHQPNNIYEFLATFMDERLFKKIEAQEQSAFRGYQARKQVKELRNTIYVEGTRKSITEGEAQGPIKSKDEQGRRKSVQYVEPDSTQGAESETKVGFGFDL